MSEREGGKERDRETEKNRENKKEREVPGGKAERWKIIETHRETEIWKERDGGGKNSSQCLFYAWERWRREGYVS